MCEHNSRPVLIKVLLLKEDKDDTHIRELIEEYYKIKEQQKTIYVKLCVTAIVLRIKVAFLAFDQTRLLCHLEPLKSLDHHNLIGANVIDYANPYIHPNVVDQFIDFKLERKIPAKPSKNIESVFYLGKMIIEHF